MKEGCDMINDNKFDDLKIKVIELGEDLNLKV